MSGGQMVGLRPKRLVPPYDYDRRPTPSPLQTENRGEGQLQCGYSETVALSR